MTPKFENSGPKPWQATALTLFPDAFPGVLGASIIGSAEKSSIWQLETVDIRKFSTNRHRTVDDTPAGGGPGMVLKPDVADAAINSVARNGRPLIYLTPRGKPLTQERVRELSSGPGLIVFCGRFEGLDQRVIEAHQMEEISIGDFVLAGGEVAAQAMIEACVRLLPGVLGKLESTEDESFETGLLEYPLYTKPREWNDRAIPEVLLSGDHGKIAEWRHQKQIEITKARRPDLWEAYQKGDDHERD
ncbi:tRNA (guanine37-N(1)-) methyltransferase [Litorimonas taeanensis]|uniref:tRNA (guanine-N(1)-)-methyltransferase n=1 Tax=Litorimonas taeanensis TaxID=568099 RepID=A0A420WJ43_9PROT|nr:tRNA (guanosine(37)-N1)-methyltransferase TrmD [Litorimonas taeanensis]RKQ70952.1 tRNA (guanine37-N(1)-) methyltransferase [Litorimonas taeanensis]